MTFDHIGLLVALLGITATLGVAIARPPWFSEAIVAVASSATVIATGAVSLDSARQAADELAPTLGFLATLLLLASGCRREGLFDALGSIMACNARDNPRRLLALVFLVSATVTAVLGLDSTIVLLTPVVFATATRLRINPKPHVYACLHLANTASLLLPVSNLTNLLAFHASGLSFARFAMLMALPTAAAIAVEWIVLTRFFATELRQSPGSATTPAPPHLPRFALGVLGATLLGFLLVAPVGIDPLWVATAGAALMTVGAFVRKETTLCVVVRAVEPSFLVFVLGLGVTVAAASNNGLAAAVHTLIPDGASLRDLLGITAISAILANLINNLPATLIVTPAVAPDGHFTVLAALIGVNVGPNLTYVGSLAILLWRRLETEGFDAVGDPAHGGLFHPHVTINWFDHGTTIQLNAPDWPRICIKNARACMGGGGHLEATVSAAVALLSADTEITLLYVASTEAETVARGALQGLLGRPRPVTGQPMSARSDQSSNDLFSRAQNLLGRQTVCVIRRGQIQHEVVAAAAGMDVLVLARDGDRMHAGPRSLSPAARFVVDHAPCAVLLVWPDFLLVSGQD